MKTKLFSLRSIFAKGSEYISNARNNGTNIAKITLIVVGVILLIVLLLALSVLWNAAWGAFLGWIIGLLFGKFILALLAKIGITGLAMWQIGAILGVISMFFRSSKSRKN